MARSVCFGVNGRFLLNLESKTWILAFIPMFILLCNSDCQVWKLDLHHPVSQNLFLGFLRNKFRITSLYHEIYFVGTGFYPDIYSIMQYELSGMETRPIGRQVRYTTPTP